MRFNSILRALLVVVIASIVCSSGTAIQYVNGPTLIGRCANFSIQAGTSVSFNGGQTNVTSGFAGVAPGTGMSGTPLFGPGYNTSVNTSAAINCSADESTAYLYLKGVTCTNLLASTDLSGLTLYAGVYCTTAGVFTLNTGNLHLDAQGDANAQFIFKTATTLITAASTHIVLANGTLVKNVYWQIGSSVTLGASSTFFGQVYAYASISVGATVTTIGRFFAQAAVTFAGTDVITLPPQC